MDTGTAPALLASSGYSVLSRPTKTAQLAGSYVLHIAATDSYYAAAASSPSNAIHLFDKRTLTAVRKLSGHDGGITSVRVADRLADSSSVITSCGKDGIVRVWDERKGGVALEMKSAGRPSALLSLDVSPDGRAVVAGTELRQDDALILFWDPRHPAAPLRSHGQTHSDDVTVVCYAPHVNQDGKRLLLSASTDGLISTSDPEENDEDEAGVTVGNWGCSVSQAGWLSPQGGNPVVWAASDMETFSFWTEELDPLQSFDIRKPSLTGPQNWSTDYLVGCQTSSYATSNTDSGLRVFAGSNDGGLVLLTPSSISSKTAPWTAHFTLSPGTHTGVVRSVFWDEPSNVLLTGGEEDGKLCAWPCAAINPQHEGENENAEMNVGSPSAGLGGRGVLKEESESEGAMEVDEPKRRKRDEDGYENGGKKARKW